MKNTLSSPNKHHFLKIDFYIQCFFFVLTSIFGLLSSFSGYFMALGLFSLLPIMLYNSIGLTYHIFKGSYSKKIELFRKVHAISAIVYLIIFVVVIFGYDNSANTNEITFIIFWIIPPFFLITYFFITWQDWKEMKKSNY